jgi:hypothetical protein
MIKKYIFPFAVLTGLVLNTLFLHSQILGFVFFGLYILIVGVLLGDILKSVFFIREKYLSLLLGLGGSVILLGFFSSIFVVWYKITPLFISFLFIFFFLAVLLFRTHVQKNIQKIKTTEENFGFIPKRKFAFFCFFALSLLQIAILILCRTDIPLLSPWQAIHPWYLYNFFLLTFVLGIIFFSKVSYQAKFLCIIAYSLLLHLYLPLVHELPWGGDVWRMIGVEQKLSAGEGILPAFPQSIINPYKYTYGQTWGLMTLLSETLHVSLENLHQWFMAIFWGLFLPVISLALGLQIFQNKNKALVLSALSSFPFALQAIGSITVAVSLGFLSFLFGLWLWSSTQKEPTKRQQTLLIAYGVLMLFGYALYALLFWLVLIVAFLLQRLWKEKSEIPAFNQLSRKKKIFTVLVFTLPVFFFPLIDFVFGFSRLPDQFSFWNFFKQTVGQFGGWFFAKPISPGEIASSNIVFNHMTEVAFVSNIFTNFRWPIILLMGIMSLAIVRGLFVMIKKERTIIWQMLAILLITVLGGYILGWYVLVGDRVFVRRLDAILAWLLLAFTLFGIFSFDFKQKIRTWSNKQKYICFTLALFMYSFVATTLYASGPDIRVVAKEEYAAAEYIFEQQKNETNPCVLADTWVLLALEAVSSGNIVGGGFPIDANFGQKERAGLYQELLKNPDARIIPKIKEVKDASSCFIALSRRDIDTPTETKLNAFLGNLIFKSGEVLIWELDLKTP